MKKGLGVILSAVLVLCSSLLLCSEDSVQQQYIRKYSKLAMSEMRRTGVPASITLAQGLLESGAGTGRLAVEANNHFGIKCHKWSGKTIKHDDDALQECFRAYDKAEESYRDHSDFLRYSDRYKFLFDIPATDYKAWAHGLKKAGYATDPKYAEKLIGMIERYNLNAYDNGPVFVESPLKMEEPRTARASYSEDYQFSLFRQVYTVNGVRFVYSQTAETYESIAKSYEILTSEILSFNDLDASEPLLPGTMVYLQKKKSKTAKGLDKYIVSEDGENLRDICQRFGVRMKSVQRRNSLDKEHVLSKDEELLLR